MKIAHFPSNLPGNAHLVYPQLLDAIRTTDNLVENKMDADVALIWSVLWHGKMQRNKAVWDHYRAQNKPVIVIEVGGLIRNTTWKLGINGINRDADFALKNYMPDDRLKKFGIVLQPWRSKGDYILICGQHTASQQWSDMPDIDTYYKQTVDQIRKHTDLPIVIRSHPRCKETVQFEGVTWNMPKQLENTYDDFDLPSMLENAKFTISHSSNAGIHSAIAGVPTVVSEHSLAYDVGSKIGTWQSKPYRHIWLKRLCYTEWFADEIDVQWNRIREKI